MNDDDLRAKRELNTGFANALSRAFELAVTTALFAGLGWLVDRWLGTGPVVAIALAVLALIGQFVRFWYAYDAEMRVHERELEARKRDGVRPGSTPASARSMGTTEPAR